MKTKTKRVPKRHTNLMNEIEMQKPKTDWVPTLVGVVAMVTICWAIFVVFNLSLLTV